MAFISHPFFSEEAVEHKSQFSSLQLPLRNIIALRWPSVRFSVSWLLIRIRIQGFDEQKLKKVYSWYFFSKIAIYWSLSLHKGHPRYRRSLQHSKENKHPALQKISISVGHFCPPGSGSGLLIRIQNTVWFLWFYNIKLPWVYDSGTVIKIRNFFVFVMVFPWKFNLAHAEHTQKIFVRSRIKIAYGWFWIHFQVS